MSRCDGDKNIGHKTAHLLGKQVLISFSYTIGDIELSLRFIKYVVDLS